MPKKNGPDPKVNVYRCSKCETSVIRVKEPPRGGCKKDAKGRPTQHSWVIHGQQG